MSLPQSLTHSQVDFIGRDVEALASHMRHCARAQGPWFSMRSHMQRVRTLAAGRIVTMACLAAAFGISLLFV
jgi:hypothetical protein